MREKEVIRYIKDDVGKRHYVELFDGEYRSEICFGETYCPIPVADPGEYAYDHGTSLFRKACNLWHKIFDVKYQD